jgi:hypothetical protein
MRKLKKPIVAYIFCTFFEYLTASAYPRPNAIITNTTSSSLESNITSLSIQRISRNGRPNQNNNTPQALVEAKNSLPLDKCGTQSGCIEGLDGFGSALNSVISNSGSLYSVESLTRSVTGFYKNTQFEADVCDAESNNFARFLDLGERMYGMCFFDVSNVDLMLLT